MDRLPKSAVIFTFGQATQIGGDFPIWTGCPNRRRFSHLDRLPKSAAIFTFGQAAQIGGDFHIWTGCPNRRRFSHLDRLPKSAAIFPFGQAAQIGGDFPIWAGCPNRRRFSHLDRLPKSATRGIMSKGRFHVVFSIYPNTMNNMIFNEMLCVHGLSAETKNQEYSFVLCKHRESELRSRSKVI